MEKSNKSQASERNRALLDSLQALTKRNAELETRIMELSKYGPHTSPFRRPTPSLPGDRARAP